MLAESIVLELCTSGVLDENIAFVKGELKARCEALVEALREKIPEAVFVVPQGGYFLWLDLAEGTDTKALLAEAKGEGVSFVAGPDFMIEGGDEQPAALLRPGARRRSRPRASAGSPRRWRSSAPARRPECPPVRDLRSRVPHLV